MPEFVTSNGVVLELRGVPSLVTVAVLKSHPKPRVPIVLNDDKGGREEENPNDPNYIAALERYQEEQVDLTSNVYLANGVKIKSVPNDYLPIESDEWTEPLRFSGIDIPSDDVGRRVAYLKYYLLQDDDCGKVITAVAIAGGIVTEAQVDEAAETFRSDTEVSTNLADETTNHAGFGDTAKYHAGTN